MFELHARENPNHPLEHIANIILTSELFRSKFGDEDLFFRHERFERDLRALRKSGNTDKKAKGEVWKAAVEDHTGA